MLKDKIKTDNNKQELRKLIYPFIERLSKKEGVLAIVLLGGLSNNNNRDHTDEFSDIDLGVIFDDNNYQDAPNYEFYVYDSNDKAIEVNVHEMLLSIEEKENWDDGKKEAYSKCEYVYEKDDTVRKFIDEKVKVDEEYRKRRIALLMGQYKWYVEINPIRAIKRGLLINGIDLLTKGIDLFIEALFLYNYQYLPHSKWRFEMALDLENIPENLEENLREALITEGVTEEGILNKREKVMTLFEGLREMVKKEYNMDIDELYEYACKNSYSDRQLLKETYADRLINKVGNDMSFEDKRLISSLINNYLIQSDEELLNISLDDIDERYRDIYNIIKERI